MRAEIVQTDQGYTATYNRHMAHSPETVWAMLAENGKLKQWFPELEVKELRKGGFLSFDMGDGAFEKMDIVDFEDGSVLAFEWDKGQVRFEILPAEGGSQLTMVESFPRITQHTAKDLAGWHVCFDVIEALLDERKIERKREWEKEYEEYKRLLQSLSVEFE